MRFTACLLLTLPLVAAAQPTPPQPDARLAAMARDRGCYLCHAVDTSHADGLGRLPHAPSWQDIAQAYRREPDAEERLVRIVLAGMGRNPGDSHWRGKVALADMPPNDYQLTAAEARELVRWILRF